MNTSTPNFPHRFKLAGMKVGDFFMGCPSCFSQYPTNAAGATRCHCGDRMLLFDIRPHNAAEVAHHNAMEVTMIKGIPWVRFTTVGDHRLTPHDLCLWWVPIRGEVEVFTGRVVRWDAADCAMVARKTGSMVRVSAGTFFAIITPPFCPPCTQIDDAIPVSGSTASAEPPCGRPGELAAPALQVSAAGPESRPPGRA